MACGDSLIHLLRTTDGRTPDNPCGLFCWEGDEFAWVEAVERIGMKVEREWKNLESAARRANNETPLEVLRPQTTDFIEDVKTMPGWAGVMFGGTLPGQFEGKIEGYIDIGRAGLCVLENLGAAVVDLGGKSQSNPNQAGANSWLPIMGGALFIGGIGYVAWQANRARGVY